MAGGTGSGLGSAMTAALRDEYPSARILNHCIWWVLWLQFRVVGY